MSCGKGQTSPLQGRAEKFGDLLIAISNMPEEKAKAKLEEFIEPLPGRAERINQYYSEFSANSKKFRIVSQSVERVKIANDGKSAEVTYRTVAQTPDGTKLPVAQVTHWRLIGNTWYRVIGEAEKTAACP
jgi:hypothetical protein